MKKVLLMLCLVGAAVLAGCTEPVRTSSPGEVKKPTDSTSTASPTKPAASQALMDRIAEQEKRLVAAQQTRQPAVEAVAMKTVTRDSGQQPAPAPIAVVDPAPAPPPTPSQSVDPVPAAPETPTVERLVAYMQSRQPLSETDRRKLALLKAVQAGADSAAVLKAVAEDSSDPAFKDIIALASAYRADDPESALQRLRVLEERLRARSPISIGAPTFCTAVTGFGRYQAIDDPVFLRGREALVYMEVRDFMTRKAGKDRWEYHLAQSATILDPAGRVAATLPGTDQVYTCAGDLRDLYWPLHFSVPNDIYAGRYILKITIGDRLKNQVAEERVSFQVK